MAKGLVVGNLRVALGLDTAEFDDGAARVNRDAKGLAANLRSGLASAANVVSSAALGMGAALAGIGFAAVVQGVRDATAEMAALSDEAKRAGLSITAFQEWKFVAEQNRIGLDAMVDGFKELNLRADEFVVTGGGSAAEAFQRLGYSAEDLKEKLKDPSALMLEIIDRLGQVDKAAQIRIFDELLGGSGGEQFVQLIDQGSEGLKKTIDRAHELGRVIDRETVERAAALDREFNQVAATVETALKTAIVQAALALRGFLDTFRSVEDQGSLTIQSRINDIMRERLDLVQKIAEEREAASQNSELAISLGFNQATENKIDTLQAKLDALNDEENSLIAELQSRDNKESAALDAQSFTPIATPDKGADRAAERAVREQEMAAQRLENLRQQLMSEEEAERFSYETRMEDLRSYLDMKLLTEAEYNDLSARAGKEHADNMANIAKEGVQREAAVRGELLGYAADVFGSLSDLAVNFGEKGFIAAKAFGIAQAVINTAEGITKALAQGGVLGFAGAAAVAAAGAAQIATIASAQPGNSSRPSVPYSSVATAAPAGATDSASRAPAYVEIKGDVFSRQAVIELMSQISDLMGDGYELKY